MKKNFTYLIYRCAYCGRSYVTGHGLYSKTKKKHACSLWHMFLYYINWNKK